MADSKSVIRPWLWLAGALLAAAFIKAWLLWLDVIPFNADEAVVALMGRHILAGERPVFFYGQAYMGSLDAWLVAMGFGLFGQQVWVIRLVQTILYLGTILTTAVLGRQVFGSLQVGVVAAWLLAIPTVNLTLYTTASLGGYGEALLIGNLILITTLRIDNRLRHGGIPTGELFVWGLLAGLGWWVFGLTLVYSLPAGLYLVWRMHKARVRWFASLAALAGALVGSSPWWGYAWQNGLAALLGELGGNAISGVEGIPYGLQLWQHLLSLLLLGTTVTLGFRPPWSADWLGLPLIPFVLLFWLAVCVGTGQELRRKMNPGVMLMLGVAALLVLAFIFTPFGADPSGRYFLPLAVPLALIGANWIVSLGAGRSDSRLLQLRWGLVVLVLGYHLWGTIQSASRYPPGLTTQFYSVSQIDQRKMPELVDFLRSKGERAGYSNYWVAYPLAFLSGEELTYIPRLPYHQDFRYTARDDRYAPYGEMVGRSERLAYITTFHPELDRYLQERFTALDLTWQEAWIGDFHVFYNLSRAVDPQEIGLGVSRP